MIEEERYFTIKEVAKLLGVPKRNIKQRVESKNLSAHKRLGKRGFELVIPQRELSLELMSSLPDSHQLSLCEFEMIVVKRLEAMAAGRDRRVSLMLKLLCEELAQLKAEIENFNVSTAENDSSAVSLTRDWLSTRHETELERSPQLRPSYTAFGVFILPHVTSTIGTTIGIVIGLLISVAAELGSIVTSRKKSSSEE